MTDKVAIFLDIENLSTWLKADGGQKLLERASELGRVVVRRAYGNFSIPGVSIHQAQLNLLGFDFVHTYHPVKGKNSADIQIIVDVMEYLARIPDLEWFVLATGDSDFSPLFRRLRELGKSVVGVGPRSVLSEAVKTSCNRFIYIDDTDETECSSSIKSQLKEDALEILERILDQFPEGLNLSILKNKMLEIDSSFDERTLGFSSFMKFLESVPEIVSLCKVNQTWYAQPLSTKSNKHLLDAHQDTADSELITPTTDLYRRLLRKSGWRSCESSFLWEILRKLQEKFPKGFTRSQEFECLIEIFGHSRTRADLRSAMYILYKVGCVIQKNQTNGENILTVSMPISEQALSLQIEALMIKNLVYICKLGCIPCDARLILPLLKNNYDQSQLESIIDNVQYTSEP